MAAKRGKKREIEELLVKLIDSCAGPMFYLNEKGAFVYGNKAYRRARQEVRAQIREKKAEARNAIGKALSGTPISRLGHVKGGNVLGTLTPVSTGAGSPYLVLGTLTEYQEIPLWDTKATNSPYLLRTMAHELKTPLSNICLTLDMLIRECAMKHKDPAKMKQLQRLKRQSFHLMELIDNFLDMAKSKEGMFEPFREKFDLDELLDELEDTIRPLAEGKGLEWNLVKGTGLPKEIESDPEMIKRVLLNFLSNACKFTEKGSVSLAVSSKPSRLIFEISDSGCGIDSKELELIFEPFIRGSVNGPRTSGFGLGLSIAKMFVKALRGKIRVESELEKGSKFTLSLPLKKHAKKR